MKSWKPGDFPATPSVTLVLNEGLGTIEGFAILTSSLSSESEIDFEVGRLQEALRDAGKQAKRVLAAQVKKLHTPGEA